MAVRSWDTPGRWTTNYSAIAYSDDNGQNWTSGAGVVGPLGRGGQVDHAVRLRQPELPAVRLRQGRRRRRERRAGEGSRHRATETTATSTRTAHPRDAAGRHTCRGSNRARYSTRPSTSTGTGRHGWRTGLRPLPRSCRGRRPVFFGLFKRTTYPTVGEMSVQYNAYEKKYIMLYADQNNNVVMRKADQPHGPWSAPTTLVTSRRSPVCTRR